MTYYYFGGKKTTSRVHDVLKHGNLNKEETMFNYHQYYSTKNTVKKISSIFMVEMQKVYFNILDK